VNPNGHADGETRIDRLERLFERSAERFDQYAERNEHAHEAFHEEHKRLLTAQVLMVDTMRKLELKLIQIGDKLDGLIGVVSGLIKKPEQLRRPGWKRSSRLPVSSMEVVVDSRYEPEGGHGRRVEIGPAGTLVRARR
jgi:hypothetical protein